MNVVQAGGHAAVASGVKAVHVDRHPTVITGLDRLHQRLQVLINTTRAIRGGCREDPVTLAFRAELFAARAQAVAVMDNRLDRLVEGVTLTGELLLGRFEFSGAERGVGLGVGIRSEDEKSVGVMPHLKVYEAASMAYRQGRTRRGSFAAYLNIDHPNVLQFIEMRKATGDANQRCLELHHGLNISDAFMQKIEDCMLDENADDSWPLIDPHTKKTIEPLS